MRTRFFVSFKCGHEGWVYSVTVEGAQSWAARQLCSSCLEAMRRYRHD